jgi:hypothetical protein
MSRKRGVALFCVGLVLGTTLVSPAGAHVNSSVKHVWKHLKPLAAKVFYTKKQSDARYYTKTKADARYYTKAGADARYYTMAAADARFALKDSDGSFEEYCARATASPGSYPAEPCTATLVLTLDAGGTVGKFTSIAIGMDWLPVISYWDETNGDLKILHCGNAACTTGNQATAASTAGNVGANSSLAIGTDGLPVVSYRDVTNGELEVLHCGNPTCTAGNQVTPVDSGDVGYDTSIAIGSDGFPVVSYLAGGSPPTLKVFHCTNPACTAGTATTVDVGPMAVATGTSIAIGTDGFPVVSYYRSSTDDLKVLHCQNVACTSSSWQIVDSAGSVGDFSSIGVGAGGLPVVSYRDGTNGDLDVLVCGDAACTTSSMTTPDTTGTPASPLGYDTSLVIGADGFPIVSYYDDAANGDLKILDCGDAACTSGNTIVTVDTAGNVGRYSSLAIGADGFPVVSFTDESNGDLKFARLPLH